MKSQYIKHFQTSRYKSPWSIKEKFGLLLWNFSWFIFCSWTPKPLNSWRILWLKIFGCKIHGKPFVHQRARIQIPWNIILHDRSCVGDRANLYSLGEIELNKNATVAQEAYLCTGTHDFNDPIMPLLTAKITVEENAFIGARAFILPGISVGKNSIIGACSVVTSNVEPETIVAGNPAKIISKRNSSEKLN